MRERANRAVSGEPETALAPVAGLDYDILPELAGFWLRRAQLGVMKSYSIYLSALRLRPVEAAALLLIGRNRDFSQVALTTALATDQSTMVAISNHLEERGLIMRRRLDGDRRYQVLALTPEGRKMAIKVRRGLQLHNANVLARLDPAEQANLLLLLTKLVT